MNKTINFDNLEYFSDKEIADFIYEKMDEEFQKDTKDIDCDFLEECALLLRQIQGKEDISTSEDVLQERWQNIVSKYKESSGKDKIDSAENGQNDNDNMPHKGISIKKLFIIAVAAALLMAGLSMAFAGADSPFTFRNMKLLDTHINDISPGETISKGNETATRADKSATYSSIQEMVTAEQLYGICCAQELEIKSINYAVYSEKINIVITPISQNKFFSISIVSTNKYGVGQDVPGRKKTTTEKGIDVWEYDKGEQMAQVGRYQLMFKINDWYYCIATSDTEKGYELINNFEEVTP